MMRAGDQYTYDFMVLLFKMDIIKVFRDDRKLNTDLYFCVVSKGYEL